MYEQNASYLVKHSDLGTKSLNLPKIVQKVLKWPLQYVNLKKFSRGVCPQTQYNLFYFQYALK